MHGIARCDGRHASSPRHPFELDGSWEVDEVVVFSAPTPAPIIDAGPQGGCGDLTAPRICGA